METSISNSSRLPAAKLGSISNDAASELAARPKTVAELAGGRGRAGGDDGISASMLLVRGTAPIAPHKARAAGMLETVLGDDERTRVLDTDQAPWRMVCSLEISSDQGEFVGTGWFAGPKMLITAGHCVRDVQMGGWAKKIVVRAGRNGAAAPFGEITATRFSTTDRWFNDRDPDFDYAAIHLSDEALQITNETGWFTTSVLNDAALQAQRVNVAGYPGDKGGSTQWFHAKQIVALRPSRIYYNIDTFGGQSGAPVWLQTDTGPHVVAIHAHGVGGSIAGVEANSGPRISEAVLRRIEEWVG